MTPTEKHREPDAWRYRYEQKPGVWGKWTVQKNKPAWWRPEQPDVQLEPLFSEAALANSEREGMKRAAEIAKAHYDARHAALARAHGMNIATAILSEAGEGGQ